MEAIDRPGRNVAYVMFAEFPAPVQQTEDYIIEAYATYSSTASQGYWRREQAGIVLQAVNKPYSMILTDELHRYKEMRP